MEIHHNISQNKTPSVSSLIKYSISKLTGVQKVSPDSLTWGLFLVTLLHIWAYKQGRLARSNNQGDIKQKSSAVNISGNVLLLLFFFASNNVTTPNTLNLNISKARNIFKKKIQTCPVELPQRFGIPTIRVYLTTFFPKWERPLRFGDI